MAAVVLLAATPAFADTYRVVDGDTILRTGIDGRERIRFLGVDAPELFSPACRSERRLAERARDRLEGLLAGRVISIERQGVDRYGRSLAVVRAAGEDLGQRMVAEGFARPWKGRKVDWCR